MSDEGNVVALPVGDARRAHNQRESEIAELPVGRARYSLDTCRHAHSVVDARARTVTCDSCGVLLDPIQVLDTIAHEFAEPLRLAQKAEKRRRELQESIERLEREERNAKSRVRTARKAALKFDADAVLAATKASYSSVSWGREWDALSEHMQDAVLKDRTKLIEAYIGALEERATLVRERDETWRAAEEACPQIRPCHC